MGRLRVPAHIESLKPYPPGKPLKELERELGISGAIKLASNESPFGPSPRAVKAAAECLTGLHRYPDGSGYYLKNRLSEILDQPPERIVLGCGTNEVLDLVCRVFVGPGGKAVLPHPSFLVYQKFLQATGAEFDLVDLDGMTLDLAAMAKAVDDKTRLVVICNPNNPTGTTLPQAEIKAFAADLPKEVILVVDEAYIDFVREEGAGPSLDLITDDSMVVVTRTFSKAYGLAGLRLGFGVMSEQVADYLNRVRQPFNITSPALAGAEAALDDQEFMDRVLDRTWAGLDLLTERLTEMGLTVYPSQTNFILFRVTVSAQEVYERMLRKGVIIRHMGSFGLDEYLRVSVGTEAENERFLEALARVMESFE